MGNMLTALTASGCPLPAGLVMVVLGALLVLGVAKPDT
jgi:hypothetical protein